MVVLNRRNLKSLLLNNGVSTLFHANTVPTASSFLESGYLLSRQQCESSGLAQTEQYTDALDKAVGVWNKLFLNIRDAHEHYKYLNFFGPIRFLLSTERLFAYLELKSGNLGISRTNIEHWRKVSEADRWFDQEPSFSTIWDRRHDLVIEVEDGRIPISLVDRVLIDPHPDKTGWAAEAQNILQSVNRFSVPIEIGNCKVSGCQCRLPEASRKKNVVPDKYRLSVAG